MSDPEPTIIEQINAELARRKLTRYALAQELEISQEKLRRWLTGMDRPAEVEIIKVVRILGGTYYPAKAEFPAKIPKGPPRDALRAMRQAGLF